MITLAPPTEASVPRPSDELRRPVMRGAMRGAMRAAIPPGGTVGILGGGPAGRAIALAARAFGYRVRALDADPTCPVGPLADHAVRAPLHHAAAAVEALGDCDVVTPSVEHVPPRTIAALKRAGVPVRPSATLMAVTQDRVLERDWMTQRGVPLLPWRAVRTLAGAHAAWAVLGGRCVLKPALRRGPAAGVRFASTPAELDDAWRALGGGPCAIEEAAAIEAELSVVVARTPSGAVATYPAAESRRGMHDGVPRLLWSVIPTRGPRPHAEKAGRLATMLAERLRVEGLIAVEMFLLADGRLVVNELVSCPHPTFLGAEQACATGQYEQLVRAICDLPLGPTTLVRPIAVTPIYGDQWSAVGAGPGVLAALHVPRVALHAYGVEAPEPAQRAGHLAAWGETADRAVERVVLAHAALRASRARGGALAASAPAVADAPSP